VPSTDIFTICTKKKRITAPGQLDGGKGSCSGRSFAGFATGRYENQVNDQSTTTPAEILAAIQTLFPAGSLIELRIPGKPTVIGYFDDQSKLADAIVEYSGKVAAVYYTLNEIDPELFAQSPNQNTAAPSKNSTRDSQITRRRFLLIDCDPVRVDPASLPLKDQVCSSTESEKDLARATSKNVYAYLKSLGWPDPLVADSGNGAHLLYRLDLDSTKELTKIVEGVLAVLANRFNTPAVKIDTGVGNPARITKAYGSMACKGVSTDERPHRKSGIRSAKGGKIAVTLDQLESLAAQTVSKKASKKPGGSGLVITPKPQKGCATGGTEMTPEKVEEFLDFYELDYFGRERGKDDDRWQWKLAAGCPFNPEHKDVVVSLHDDGKLGYKCFHKNTCAGSNWKALREHLEKTTDKLFRFFTNSPQAVPANTPTKGQLVLQNFSTIKPEALEWLWPNRIPFGKLTLFVGHPGIGKGCATMDIAARVSTGSDFPDSKNTTGAHEVLILSSEDDPGDTLTPRLMACHADLSKIQNLKMTTTEEGVDKEFTLDTDLPMLRKTLEANPNIKLLSIDPIMNHLGKIKGNAEQEFRAMSTPLGRLAAEFKIAIILVTHYNKNLPQEAIQRVGGAMAVVGAVRMAWGFAEDDEGERLMVNLKANVAKDLGGLEYDTEESLVKIDGKDVPIAHIVWGSDTQKSISEVMKSDKNNASTKTKDAMVWLADFMKDGDKHCAGVVLACAKEAHNFKKGVLKDAYNKLGGIKPFKGMGKDDGWYWKIEKAVVEKPVEKPVEKSEVANG
jgi:hypothetical protein